MNKRNISGKLAYKQLLETNDALSKDEENIQWGPPKIKFISDRWVDALLPKSIILVAACVSYTEVRLNILWGGRCNLMAHKNA